MLTTSALMSIPQELECYLNNDMLSGPGPTSKHELGNLKLKTKYLNMRMTRLPMF